MAPFEIVILIIIYMICYGFLLAMVVKEDNIWLRILLAIVSLLYAIYVPITIGTMLYDKLRAK